MFQSPAERATVIEQKTNTDECDRYVYSMNVNKYNLSEEQWSVLNDWCRFLKIKRMSLVALGLCGTFCCS